jgi:hypothetical protein
LSLKTKVDGLSVVWPQNHWDNFFWFGLKIGGDGFLQFSLKTGGNNFLVEPQNQGGGAFLCFGLQTRSYGLMIWISKLPRRVLALRLKIKHASICQLRHKTDGRMRRRGTCVKI